MPDEPVTPSEQPSHEPGDAEPPEAQPHDGAVRAPLTEHEEWLDEPDELDELDELPVRPRRRLLSPLPLSLLAVLLLACGFIGGVLVEKGQGSASASAGSGLAARFAALRGAGSASGGSASGGSGSASAGGAAGATGGGFALAGAASGRGTVGQVAYVSGSTLYLTTGEGNTVKVATSKATTVSRTVSSSVKHIHPGETVTITGPTATNGAVSAESIRVGSGGGGLAALLGSAPGSVGSGSSNASPGQRSAASGSGAPALFGNR